MTLYLTPQQVLFIHFRLIRETGGKPELRDLGDLLAVLEKPKSMENGQEVYPGLYKKSAVLMDGILKTRPFNNGNKQTAIAVVDLFLRINRQRLGTDAMEMVRFVQKCAYSPVSLEYMTAWLWQYARPLPAIHASNDG
jgi:death on curing protein